MKLVIGGAIWLILGVVGCIFWCVDVLIVLKGAVPILLILASLLILYLGIGEMREVMKQRAGTKAKANEEIEQYRQEIEKLKKEVELLRAKEMESGIPPWMAGNLSLGEEVVVETKTYDTPDDKI